MARYIDADKIRQAYCGDCGISLTDELCHRDCAMWNVVDSVPTEDVQPVVHGKWDICPNVYYPNCSVCSVCLYEQEDGKMTKYCPNCGARMDGKEEM